MVAVDERITISVLSDTNKEAKAKEVADGIRSQRKLARSMNHTADIAEWYLQDWCPHHQGTESRGYWSSLGQQVDGEACKLCNKRVR